MNLGACDYHSAFYDNTEIVHGQPVRAGFFQAVVEACPSDHKEQAMSLLHSFYRWGHVGAVLVSTVFFALFGVGLWRVLALVWALIPLGNMIAFIQEWLLRLLQANRHSRETSEQILPIKNG